MFGEAPGIYQSASRAVCERVERARVVGVHVSSEKVWGTPNNTSRKTGCTWHHMHLLPPASMLYRGTVKTAGQRAAELTEDHGTLARALAEDKTGDIFRTALQIAQSESLYRGENVEGRLRWLVDLHEARAGSKGLARDNLLWRAVATAPAGFCHVRSSVVGSLLEDIGAGKSFAEVKRAFDAKMDPLKYQRPTAPPSAGNVKQAEEVVAKLGSAGALRRRFARIEDVQVFTWAPVPSVIKSIEGVFGHLLDATRPTSPMIASAPTMTWEKFARTVLPTAEAMQVHVPSRGNFLALVTAADPDAPPIIQWDRENARNPVTWYTYVAGSRASQWNLASALVPVVAVTPMPNMWQGNFAHHGEGVLLILEGCRDLQSERAGLGLFPELLKSEYHAVRSTIEAHSCSGRLEDVDQATACGLAVRRGNVDALRIRVLSRGVATDHTIDRWD